MYIVRDIFQSKFGHFRPVKALMEEAMQKGMMPEAKSNRILSDFTGDSYPSFLKPGMITCRL